MTQLRTQLCQDRIYRRLRWLFGCIIAWWVSYHSRYFRHTTDIILTYLYRKRTNYNHLFILTSSLSSTQHKLYVASDGRHACSFQLINSRERGYWVLFQWLEWPCIWLWYLWNDRTCLYTYVYKNVLRSINCRFVDTLGPSLVLHDAELQRTVPILQGLPGMIIGVRM